MSVSVLSTQTLLLRDKFFMYRSLEYVMFTSCTLRRVMLYCNVGWCIERLGLSVTVCVRVRARAREWISLSCFCVDKHLCLAH